MSKTIIISEKQVEQLKKVRQGIIAYEENKPDYEIGFEKPVDMSSYAHIVENKTPVVLKEENGTQKRKCVEIITDSVPNMFQTYLDMPLEELPSYLKSGLNPDGALFQSIVNNTNGCNKFIDYLRINLYQQFGIGRGNLLTYFIPGIARIACKDLGFYSFSPYEMKGGLITKFSRLLKLINRKENFLQSANVIFNEDFNGMSYEQLMTVFQPIINQYINDTHNGLENEKDTLQGSSEYEIIPVPDMLVDGYGGKILKPTREGREILNYFAKYTDWCVCGNLYSEEEYSQYLSDGGKMYICAKKGFENITRPETTETPLDEYGLSLLCVIVGEDGLPNNVTTRYNHDFGGENHNEMWEASHLQKLLGVPYSKVFKPREKEELRAMHLSEGRILTENQNDKKANDYIKNVIGIKDFERIRNFIMGIYEIMPYARLGKGYFLLGIVRMIHKDSSRFSGARMNSALRNIFQLYGDSYTTKLDRNFNGMSFDELMEKYYQAADVVETNSVKKIRQVANGYTIKHIETYDEMRETCDGEWCISYDDSIWYEFVEEDNCCVYVVENEEMINSVDEDSEEWEEANWKLSDPDDNTEFGTFGSGIAPYDTYGLSRFVVLVNPSYCMVYSRWNIPNCLDGEFLNGEQIQQLLGISFKEAFPYIEPIEYDEDDEEMFEERQIVNESLEPEEVDLSSFEIKDKLNPKFWKDNKIDSRIRLKLLDIADDFVDSLEVKWAEPEDIIMTGSLANFTWNEEYSDIDLHIVMDFKKVDKRTDFVQNYFKSKKKEWEDKHENLKIYGFPIEVYVQDKYEKHTASGVYSLEKNEWIIEPDKKNFDENDYEDDVVKQKVSEYTKKIDKLLEDFEEKTTESDIETIYNKSVSLFNKIKDERNDELHAKDAKELSNGNLIFKSLRRNGYIEKLINLRNNSYDKYNSLN